MVIPRTGPGDGVTVAALGAADLLNHATETSDHNVVLLLFCSSLAFLLPAHTAFLLGRLWHAWVFLLMAILSATYHASGSHFHDGSDTIQKLMLVYHGWAYFVFLQMAFLVLGPEDPHMQWIDHPAVVDTPRSSLGMTPPKHVMVLARVLPIAAILLFLCFFPFNEDFHWQLTILSDTLLLFGCAAFWMHRDRRSSMPKVLLRIRFWKRLWNRCALPTLLASFIWALTESTDARVMQALCQVLVALLAASIVKTVHKDSGDLHSEAVIMMVSPQNPVVARALLGSVAMFGLPTLIFSLVLDWWSVGFWRWPMISNATHQRPGGYFVVIGALPTLMAQAFAFWLVGSTAGCPQTGPEEIVLSKQFGCIVGYISVAFGLLALATPDPIFPTLHSLCMIAFLCLTMMAMVLTTLSTSNPLAPGMRSRSIITCATFALVTSFLMLLILVQQYVPNAYNIPHSMLAASEYATLALPTLWPLTWGQEVQARWRAHKAWRSFGNIA